jgi:hypothetical protein
MKDETTFGAPAVLIEVLRALGWGDLNFTEAERNRAELVLGRFADAVRLDEATHCEQDATDAHAKDREGPAGMLARLRLRVRMHHKRTRLAVHHTKTPTLHVRGRGL